MPETSRDVVVVLLDETTFTVPVKPTLLASELLDMAASHCKVKEKDYFGLMTEGDGYKNWLELDKPVLDPSQDLPKGSGQIKMFFTFKYFVDDVRFLQDYVTVELLYQFSRQAIMKGDIVTDDLTVFELAACVLQVQCGEYKNDKVALQQLKQLKVIPASVFSESSVHNCDASVIDYYRMMKTLSRGEAVVRYLDIITSLPMYPMHYFDVKDKKEVLQWLGVGPDGITVSSSINRNELEDEKTQRFQWLQLQNIYYRDRKFSMEVYQNLKANKKGSFGPVSVHAWYGSNAKVVMAIWKMSRDQHMFYRSKRASRSPHVHMSNTEILRQLNKLHASNISPSSSHSSLSVESSRSNQMQASAEAVAAAKAAQNEMYQALLTRRQQLVADLETRAAQYKDLLVKEMYITGIPPEGLTSEEIERMRKRFGVSFKFSKFVLDDSTAGSSEVEELEKQLEIQSSIIEASKTLLSQANTRRLKKDRKKEIREALDRYQTLEDKLQEVKRSQRGVVGPGGTSTKFHVDSPSEAHTTTAVPGSVLGGSRMGPSGSVDDTVIASLIWDSPSRPSRDAISPSPGLQRSPLHKSTSALTDLQGSGVISTATPSVTTSHFNYHGHPHLTPHNSREYHNRSTAYRPPEDVMFSPPPLPLPPTSAGGSPRNQGVGLPDFDLTDEIFQHFSGRSHREVTPPTSGIPDYLSPRQTSGSDARSHFPLPPNQSSSPIKRTSSPDIGAHFHGDQRARSNSPDVFLPTPEHYRYRQQQPISSSYSNSYHPPTPGRQARSNPPSRSSSSSKANYRAGVNPQSVTSPPWYDGTGMSHHHHMHPHKPHSETSLASHREEGGASRQGQQQQSKSAAVPLPRRHNEESVEIQEFLHDLAKSKTNPFSEGGTLV